MSYIFKQKLLDSKKYRIKSPYAMKPTEICVHNTFNDASAENEASYHNRNNNATSYHVAIDNKEVIQLIPFNRNAFHAGDGANGKGNRNAIGIEICYSKSGGERYIEAEQNAVEYIASLLHAYGWDVSKVKKHQDYSGKYCPHRILSEGRWEKFKARIAKELEELKGGGEEELIEQLKKELEALKKEVEILKNPKGEISEWAKPSYEWARKLNITDGTRPHDKLTRQEAWLMLKRYNDNNK